VHAHILRVQLFQTKLAVERSVIWDSPISETTNLEKAAHQEEESMLSLSCEAMANLSIFPELRYV
jgi:hypothetical protein